MTLALQPYNSRKAPGQYDPAFLDFEHQAIERAIKGSQDPIINVTKPPFNVKGDGSDETERILDAIAAGYRTYFPKPPSYYKMTAPIEGGPFWLEGDGMIISAMRFFGCPAVEISTDDCTIRDLNFFLLDGAGTPDPKVDAGIAFLGSGGAGRLHYHQVDRVFVRGAKHIINLAYTWDSDFSRIYGTNCENGFRTFGQSCNNTLYGPNFQGISGHGVSLERDGAVGGEGLMVYGGLVTGDIGLFAEGFVGLNFTGVTVDQTSQAVWISNGTGSIIGCWLYAQQECIIFGDLSALSSGHWTITGNHKIWSVLGKALRIGALNRNIKVSANPLISTVALLDMDATAVDNIIEGNQFDGGGTIVGNPHTNIIRNNKGIVTESSGAAVIGAAAVAIVVNHGLSFTPTLQDISVTPTNNLGAATRFWISTVTATQFTINVDVAPGAPTATFAWRAGIV